MSNVNSVTISGNLTRDPEVVDGHDICKLGVAVNRSYKPSGSDERVEEVSFFDITVFGGFAKLTARKLKKADAVTVQGRLKQDTWETEDGKRSKVYIIADQIDSEGYFRSKDDENTTSSSSEAPAADGAAPASAEAATTTQDDDIPF